MTQSYQLIVFDWDGTLMDSVARIVASMQNAFTDVTGTAPSVEAVKEIIGLSLDKAIATLAPHADAVVRGNICDRYRHHFVDASEVPMALFPRVLTMLESLKQEGFMLAVATGKARRGLDRVFADTGCGHLFNASRCADETESKPHPRMLNELMQELNVGPRHTLMVGDSEFDMLLANNAEVDALAVSYGVHSRKRLLQSQPLACVDSVSQLELWLTQLSSYTNTG